MSLFFVFAAMISNGIESNWKPVVEPLKEALSGKAECRDPNHKEKICYGFATYHSNNEGSIRSSQRIPIDEDSELYLKLHTDVTIQNNVVCSTFRDSDFAQMEIVAGGLVQTDKKHLALLEEYRDELSYIYSGSAYCGHYYHDAQGRVRMKAFLDGEAFPEADSIVGLIDKSAQYKILMQRVDKTSVAED